MKNMQSFKIISAAVILLLSYSAYAKQNPIDDGSEFIQKLQILIQEHQVMNSKRIADLFDLPDYYQQAVFNGQNNALSYSHTPSQNKYGISRIRQYIYLDGQHGFDLVKGGLYIYLTHCPTAKTIENNMQGSTLKSITVPLRTDDYPKYKHIWQLSYLVNGHYKSLYIQPEENGSCEIHLSIDGVRLSAYD